MKFLLSISLIIFAQLSFAGLTTEKHRCETGFSNGKYTGYQAIEIKREEQTSDAKWAAFELSFSYKDFLVYTKGTNQLVGDRVKMEIPAFPEFADWVQTCVPDAIRSCDLQEYEIRKAAYENDPAWVLETYEITPENPDYQVVITDFKVVQSTEGELELKQNSGYDGRYQFVDDQPLNHKVFITNQFDSNRTYIDSKLWASFGMVDGRKFFSPFLNIKFVKGGNHNQGTRITQPCTKE